MQVTVALHHNKRKKESKCSHLYLLYFKLTMTYIV